MAHTGRTGKSSEVLRRFGESGVGDTAASLDRFLAAASRQCSPADSASLTAFRFRISLEIAFFCTNKEPFRLSLFLPLPVCLFPQYLSYRPKASSHPSLPSSLHLLLYLGSSLNVGSRSHKWFNDRPNIRVPCSFSKHPCTLLFFPNIRVPCFFSQTSVHLTFSQTCYLRACCSFPEPVISAQFAPFLNMISACTLLASSCTLVSFLSKLNLLIVTFVFCLLSLFLFFMIHVHAELNSVASVSMRRIALI